MAIEVVQADITTLDVDAIVNAANEGFRGGGGVDGAIHAAAGPELLAECARYDHLPTGEAILTQGYRLKAKVVIHTVGPIWRGGRAGEPALLRRAYESVFREALAHGGVRSIAFPSISTGVYGYPKRAAAEVAVEAMRARERDFERIIACAFSAADAGLYREVLAR